MKRYDVVFTLRAEKQLDDLFVHISARSGKARAEKFVGAVVKDCLALAIFSRRGTKRDDIRPGLRIKGYARRVTIAFSVDAQAQVVAIYGVFYGGQDFEPVLRNAKK